MAIIVAGFSSANRIPGAFGEVKYGAGGQSAASIPLLLLLVGLKTSAGALAVDTEVRQVFDNTSIDAACGQGSELANQAYDAILAAPSVPTFVASPALPGGAVAANVAVLVGGTWTSGGTIKIKINGKIVPVGVTATMSPAQVATAISDAVKGSYLGHLPITASASSSTTTLSSKTPNARGNQHIVKIDLSEAPSGLTATLTGNVWVTVTVYATSAYAVPTIANGFYYKATTGGTAAASEPTWPTTIGTTVADGTVTWTCWGQILTGGAVTLGGGSGLETYTNLLATIRNSQFDTIALAANDATSLAAWETQADAQVIAPDNILQQLVVATNGTLAGATSIAQTTLNNPLFQLLWQINGQTHPSQIAAAMAATRTALEQDDPAAAAQYNWRSLPTVAAHDEKSDVPGTSTLITALLSGITPVSTQDGHACVVRSITTKCLTSSNPDYSTYDTSESRCPQFVLKDLKLLWRSFALANPRVQPDPLPEEKLLPEGVAYPQLWGSKVNGRMQDYALGKNPGTSPAPIVTNVVPPTMSWDPVAERIMLSQEVTVARNNAQAGILVAQV